MPAVLSGYDPEDDDPSQAPADPVPLAFDPALVGPEYLMYVRQAAIEASLKELGIT